MEAKYASMMKKMTPPASETGACDEEEPKEEQEEQVTRSTPVVQALVQSAVANVITEDGMTRMMSQRCHLCRRRLKITTG